MQIGSCWFDRQNKQLIDQSKDISWPLNDQEYWVLEQLAAHRGQVVSIQQLKSPNMHRTNMIKIVEALIQFLGKEHASLLEYIPNQGVILYKNATSQPSRLLVSPYGPMSYRQYLFVIILVIAGCVYAYSGLSTTSYIKADYSKWIMSKQGGLTELLVYAADDEQYKLNEKIDVIAKHIKSCDAVIWQSITLALSSDKLSFSLVMKRQTDATWLYHNVKLSRAYLEQQWLSAEWLKEVQICD
ncbi:helix-turn-helix domain-containing protein [Shewanella subflava]|uniref:Helix-turn-helix domain-containing protein n=1 Tax=Shewanella subflava TaxID=2986476 RepID=A0ABT3I6M3_9GAMM|nr:hypothetical protein [Shewanella subflava]MCW3171605.1 hypothetical protein [Shewanella subflava]